MHSEHAIRRFATSLLTVWKSEMTILSHNTCELLNFRVLSFYWYSHAATGNIAYAFQPGIRGIKPAGMTETSDGENPRHPPTNTALPTVRGKNEIHVFMSATSFVIAFVECGISYKRMHAQ